MSEVKVIKTQYPGNCCDVSHLCLEKKSLKLVKICPFAAWRNRFTAMLSRYDKQDKLGIPSYQLVQRSINPADCYPFPNAATAYNKASLSSDDVVWVVKRYSPLDERFEAPVQRHKTVVPPCDLKQQMTCVPKQWIPPIDILPPKSYIRPREETAVYPSMTSSRSEEWSTIRELLPSMGAPLRRSAPDWGSGAAPPPAMSVDRTTRFPQIESQMTR